MSTKSRNRIKKALTPEQIDIMRGFLSDLLRIHSISPKKFDITTFFKAWRYNEHGYLYRIPEDKLLHKSCLYCGAAFTAWLDKREFCSNKCKALYNYHNKKRGGENDETV